MPEKMSHSLFRSAAAVLAAALLPLFSGAALGASDSDVLFNARLTDLDGKPASLESYRGKPLIVNFWARLCMPCRAEMPELNALSEKYRDKGLAVVGIAVEDETASIHDFVKAYELNYPMMHGKDAGIRMMMELDNKIAGLPFTVVVDRNGRIVQQKMGALTPADIQKAVDAVLP